MTPATEAHRAAAVPAGAARGPSPWPLVIGALFLLAIGQQAWNLARYPAVMGFDAHGNWQYIASLIAQWKLPAPGDGWSAAHPPLFYALGAALGRLIGATEMEPVARVTVAASNAVGLAATASVLAWIARCRARDGARLAIATALLLFVPVRLYTSAMLSEEILAASFVTFAVVGLLFEFERAPERRSGLLAPAALGLVAGLGLLTKLSAAPAIGACVFALAVEGPRRGWKRSLASATAFGASAAIAGGWFYVHNIVVHGFLYPHALSVHELMFDMPPGERGIVDYVRFPLAAFSAAESSDPALLHSVWGSLWASAWFDSHRHFVPLHPTPGLRAAARILTILGIVPATAFVVGLSRGLRRAVAGSAADRLLVSVAVLLLAGFVAFTWRNPWFATVKASYLLALAVPWAVYSSEVLRDWAAAGRRRAWALAAVLAGLCVVGVVTFSYNAVFVKQEYPGTQWKDVPR